MNKYQKGFAPIVIALIVLILTSIGGTGYYLIKKQSPKQTVCTTDAKICPEGSSVGRTGPNCEFAACPEEKVDETANWITYKYEKYGFEIKYPPTWTPDISTTYEFGALGFTSSKNEDEEFMNFWINRYKSSEIPDKGTPNTIINGLNVYKDDGYVRNPDGPSTQFISFERNDYFYVLTFQVFKKYNLPSKSMYEDIKPAIFTSEEKAIWDNFISTLKFL
ncbi:MAG: hypothetical protein M0R23_10475 [Bacteroidales bacterium]|nr:hypothetical protein [Bacteroidales bacterium]